jgi:N-acetylglucosamine kinase-like BadF-type ATPase
MTGHRVLVGVDAGGTKTAVAVMRGGEVAGRAEGAGGALRPGRTLVASATIADTVRRALSSAGVIRGDALVVGAAGAGRDAEARELQQALRAESLADAVLVTSDSAIALEAAFEGGRGIVLSAGTGSIAFARDGDGAFHRAGGYGWQMGDEGSGYAIGRAALGAVGRARDARGAETKLLERLSESTRSPDFDALVRWAATAGPAEVATLAAPVASAAAESDAVATAIIHYAAEELAQLVLSLRKRLGDDAIPVALTGGLLTNPALDTALRARLARDGVVPVDRPVDAVSGALRLAAKM